MALTRRGRVITAVVAAVVIVVGAIGAMVALGGPNPVKKITQAVTGHQDAPTCPLTGLKPPDGKVPNRPALAIKVENLPQARPQYGLQDTDIVYEEPVEAGITRFIAIFQCHDSSRIEPVRSGRVEDADVLRQYGRPLFGYAGGVPQVQAAVRRAGLVNVNFLVHPNAYHRDPARVAPHNLYTSTHELWQYAPKGDGPPKPVFTYSSKAPDAARKISGIHLPFSFYSDVYWRWSQGKHAWLRSYGTVPATLADGSVIQAKNVVVQVVRVTLTGVTDVNGIHSPFAHTIGSGRAFVLRGGKVITGRWERPSASDQTKFVDSKGNVIPLAPGNTWVELFPSGLPITLLH